MQWKAIFVRDQIDCDTQVPEAATATDTMQISFSVAWKIEIYHNVHRLNVDTSSQKVLKKQEAFNSFFLSIHFSFKSFDFWEFSLTDTSYNFR